MCAGPHWRQNKDMRAHKAIWPMPMILEKASSKTQKWLSMDRSAANQGLMSAQNNLAYLYNHGIEIRQDLEEAVRWYRLTAEQGSMPALENLKKINTLRAFYAIALLEKNEAEAIQLALTHDELQKDFFENDFLDILSSMENTEAKSDFLRRWHKSVLAISKNPQPIHIQALLPNWMKQQD